MDSASVQHLTKKSSDELLKKFAELDNEKSRLKRELRMTKRLKRSRTKEGEASYGGNNASNNMSLAEKRRLLPPTTTTRRSVLLRQLRARYSNNKSLFGTIEKTWRRTVEGASKVFIEKHYNRHRRLINDVV